MKQMWDKKEIETLIDEHGGGGSGAKWGQITGTLSDQTDLKNALDAKQDTIDSSHKLSVSLVDGLATVATSGDYDDLINKPDALTIDEKTIITDAETGDIKTAIGGYVKDNSIEHTTVLPFDEGYYAIYNTPENITLYNLFNSLEVNQHFDIYFEKSSDGQTWEADSHNPVDCYISNKGEDEVVVWNDDVYDNGFTCTNTMIEVGLFGDFEDDTYIRMRIVIGDLEIEEIDGRVVPVDGTTITLNASNKLQGFSGNYNDLTNKPTIPDTTYLVSTNTSQTISAQKTFNAPIVLKNQNDNIWSKITSHGTGLSHRLEFYTQTGTSDYIAISATNNVYPVTNGNTSTLGTSTYLWKDLYLSGNLSNGTKAVSIANIATLNTAQTFTKTKTFDDGLNSKEITIYNINGPSINFAKGNTITPFGELWTTNDSSAGEVEFVLQSKLSGHYSKGIRATLTNDTVQLYPDITGSSTPNRILGDYADLGGAIRDNRWTKIYLNGTISDGTHEFSMPSATGTLALTSDIPDIYYKDGDKFKNSNYLQLYGYITNGGKDIQITIILPKLLTNIASVDVNKISMITRGVSGYVGGNSYTDYAADPTNYTISSIISAENAINITIRANTAWSGGQNNTPVCAVINNTLGSLELTFNEA